MNADDLSPELARAIEQLAREVLDGSGPEQARAAAMRACGLPVYSDMGGTLVLRPDGVIVYYDPQTDECQAEDDVKWQRLALRHASQDYPELRALLPVRPDDAIECAHCDGRGQVDEFDCWSCAGLGWTSR